MMKLYTLAALLVAGTTSLSAQQAIEACTTASGGLEITFDDAANCAAAPGELADLSAIGFHSGANQWSSVVTWDAGNATTGAAVGNGRFKVTIDDLEAYYGTSGIENVFFVFNQGPADPADPWSAEGKTDDGSGGCADFSVVLADLQGCTTSSATEPLDVAIALTGNPMVDAAVLQIANADGAAFDVRIADLSGRTVRQYSGFAGETLSIERGDLAAGMYVVAIADRAGRLSTLRLAVR